MNRSEHLWDQLLESRSIALLNPKSPEDCLVAYEALAPRGVVLEVAFRSEHALPGIKTVLQAHPEALLMAGTVMTRSQAEAALDAGVAGVVSADYLPGVVEACVDADVMCVPGGLADCGKQLVQKAEAYGYALEELRQQRPWQWVYKIFPAAADWEGVQGTIKAWRSVYPGIRFIYTGGVTPENVGGLSRDDPEGIFCGSALVRRLDDPAGMEEDVKGWVRAVSGVRVEGPLSEKGTGAPGREGGGTAPGLEKGGVATSPATMNGVVTFGEIMLRLSPQPGSRFKQASSFDATYGGAEANVAASLAQWGVPTRFVTALPDQDLGSAAVAKLQSVGVDTSAILRRGDRIGIYFLEHGASQRPSRVIYDRAGSAVAGIRPGEIDWEKVFEGAGWFHWTGITPALSESAAAVTVEAVEAAKDLGLTVSTDLNFRSKLWSKERAREVMTPLVERVDLVVGNEEDASDVFGIRAGSTDVERGSLDFSAYEEVTRALVERFDLRMAAITLRESHSASENSWSACLFDGTSFLRSASHRIKLVDRVGGGDAFTAGLIYGLLSGKEAQAALEFGVAASCLKQTITGDFNLVTVSEVEALAGGSASGRIRR
ncbi:MAG: KHG/KDPG aldolase/sugar kinase fusion protein [Gemmatimonadota bacterium]